MKRALLLFSSPVLPLADGTFDLGRGTAAFGGGKFRGLNTRLAGVEAAHVVKAILA